MHKATKILFLVLILSATIAHADVCSSTTTSRLAVENGRPFAGIEEPFTFYAYYLDSAGNPIHDTNTSVQAVINGSRYNMTNLTSKWSLTITSNTTEDISIIVNATSLNYSCKSVTFVTKWRTPFYVTFKLYRKPLNSSNPEAYTNDFQYVVLVNSNLKNSDDMTIYAFNKGVDNLFDGIFGAFTDASISSIGTTTDSNVYFWGAYSGGQATIKLYEPGNYSAYVMNNKIVYPINYFYEFEKPATDQISYMGNIVDDNLKIYNQTNISATPLTYNNTIYRVSLTKFEANTYYAIMNIGKILLVLVLFFLGLMAVIFLTQNSQSAGQVILYYIIGAGAIALSFIFYIQ